MGDAWDDDEFEVPTFGAAASAPTSWDDEEEDDEGGAAVAPDPATSAKTKEKQRQTAALKKAAAVEAELQKSETAEERKLREQRAIEAADAGHVDDLFGGGDADAPAAKAPAAKAGQTIPNKLEGLKEHLALALQIQELMKESKPNFVLQFVKELLKANEPRWDTTELAGMIELLTNAKIKKEEAGKTATKKVEDAKKKKKTKKEQLNEKKKQNDTFGDNDYADEFSGYADKYEDDFF